MAATKTKKPIAKRALNKEAKQAVGKLKKRLDDMGATVSIQPANGEAAANRDFAPNQTPLIPDADERVPELDEACAQVLANIEKCKALRQDNAECFEAIGKMLGEYGLNCYIINGKKFTPIPGEPTIRISKVKQG